MRQGGVKKLGLFFCTGVVVVLSWTGLNLAQTVPDSLSCGAGFLPLVSPDGDDLSVRLSAPGERFGAIVRWRDLADSVATCAAIIDSESVLVTLDLACEYRSDFDREVEFFFSRAGEVGGTTWATMSMVDWGDRFPVPEGEESVGGTFLLGNNGGVLRYQRSTDTWTQMNAGLPQHLRYTDILALAQSPQDPEHFLLLLGSAGDPQPTGRTQGLWERTGSAEGSWSRIASDVFPDGFLARQVVFAPDDDATFAVGTNADGLFITFDGGASFQQWTTELAPGLPYPANFKVTALSWTPGGDLFVAVAAFGLFVSHDGGQSFVHLENLLVPDIQNEQPVTVFPQVNLVVVDPSNPDHLLVAVDNNALFHSSDTGETWEAMTGDWITVGEEGWKHNGLSVLVNPADPQEVLVGTEKKGIWRTTDGGAHWVRVAEEILPQEVSSTEPVHSLFYDPLLPGTIFGATTNHLLTSGDGGFSWAWFEDTVPNASGNAFLPSLAGPGPGQGDLFLASLFGGIYEAGTLLPIADTGMMVSFAAGPVDSGATFSVLGQDFQGYAIWRCVDVASATMQLIGLYDKTNPESCIEGNCADQNYNINPNCFSERRAACFCPNKMDPGCTERLGIPEGWVEFFDDDVFNGFTYFYAVTTFDYGSTAGVEPPSLAQEMLFSPRFDGDDNSPFTGPGNLIKFTANVHGQPLAGGEGTDEVIVIPNPLRQGTGFRGGRYVMFTNLPDPPDTGEIRIKVFTLDGDVVADLAHDNPEDRANLYWDTANQSGEVLASGVYIWKTEIPGRDDFYGKLVIIR